MLYDLPITRLGVAVVAFFTSLDDAVPADAVNVVAVCSISVVGMNRFRGKQECHS